MKYVDAVRFKSHTLMVGSSRGRGRIASELLAVTLERRKRLLLLCSREHLATCSA